MPILFYQSLNSSSSSNHGVISSTFQNFTVDTHSKLGGGSAPWKLDMPIADGGDPHRPVEGPANLIKSSTPDKYVKKAEGKDDKLFLSMIEGKAKKTHQHINREFGSPCDLFVYGEVDGSNIEWKSLGDSAGKLLRVSFQKMACNNFSLHAHDLPMHDFICEGKGWVAVKSYGVIAVFVHVPNKVAKKEEDAVGFYSEIKNEVLRAPGGGIVDVIMGDTNQPERVATDTNFTERVLRRAFNQDFRDAHKEDSIKPADSYTKSFKGTNSSESWKYDVAMYNADTVNFGSMEYISQFAGFEGEAAAVTDHMGVALQVLKFPFAR